MKLLLALLSMLMLSSCVNEISDNPVDAPPGTGASISPFLGNWRLVNVGTDAPTNRLMINIRTNQAGSVIATFVTAEESNDHAISFSAAGGAMLASVQQNTDSWNIYSISNNMADTQIFLGLADPAILSNDVKNGALSGQVISGGKSDGCIHLTATSAQLRSYFATKTNIFIQAMSLQRQ